MNEQTSTASEVSPTPTRVLIAEDDEKSRIALKQLLQRHGFEVTVVDNGQSALKVMTEENPPHIAMLDWEMPGMDGLRVCLALRTLPADHYIYVIMVTGRDEPNDVLAAFGAGVDDFLPKPVDSAQLLARLRCGERVIDLESRLAQRITDLQKAIDEVGILKNMLPICMYCKKIRDDGNYWQEIESYIHKQTGTDFSHGICPDCMDVVRKHEMPDTAVERTYQRM